MYAHITEGLDQKGFDELDKELAADPALLARVGRPSQGADALVALMGGARGKKNGAGG